MNKMYIIMIIVMLNILCVTTLMLGIWAVDIGASAMTIDDGYIITLVGDRNPVDHYHWGLWLSQMSFVSLTISLNMILVFGMMGRS